MRITLTLSICFFLLASYACSSRQPLEQAYDYLLRSEEDNRKDNYLLSNDSLLDIAVLCFKKHGNKVAESRALLNKGRIWMGLDNKEDALRYFYEALETQKDGGDRKLQSQIYNELGRLYFADLLFDEALSMFDKCFYLDSLDNRREDMIYSLGGKGQVYLLLDEPESAFSCFEKAHNISMESEDSARLLGHIYNWYSLYYQVAEDHKQSLDYIRKSLSYDKEDEDNTHKLLTLGDAFMRFHQYDSARHYLRQSITSGNIFTQASEYESLYELERASGNPEKAIEYLIEYQNRLDSIIDQTLKSETEKLTYKYNVERAVSEARTKSKMTILILIIVFSIILLFSIVFFLLKDKKRKLQEKEKEQEILRNQKEILKKEKEISGLIHKVNMMQTGLSDLENLKSDVEQYEKLIDSKKEELFILLLKDTNSYCERSRKSPIYARIIELSSQKKDKNMKILTYPEQEILDREIKKIFSRFIHELSNSFPGLTDDDIKLCCLSLLKLNTHSISLCFTVSGANTIKQRRHRLKMKMAETTEDSFMYDFIFPETKRSLQM